MKRVGIFLITLLIVSSWCLTASARHDWRGHDQPYHRGGHWQHHHPGYHHERDSMPFGWHDHHRTLAGRHHMERVYDRDFDHRFPGLHAYRWSGHSSHHQGFWHHGHYINDAVLFFDRDGGLVSFGYMANGAFIYVRDDNEVYRNHDSFFLSWWGRR